MNTALGELTEVVSRQGAVLVAVREQVAKVIVGQTVLVDRLLAALLARGHLLVEGVPGLAKTRTINALAQAVALDFRRIQFTPDLLPSDLTGTTIYRPQDGRFEARKGLSFQILSSPTRSTEPPQRCSPRCSRRWLSGRSRSVTERTRSPSLSP